MKKLRAYKFRFYPTQEEQEFLNQVFGCCRFVFNHFLQEKQRVFREESRTLSYAECSKKLSELKEERTFLKEVSSVNLQQSLRHLEDAFKKFYKKQARFPRLKKRRAAQSASFMRNAFKYENGSLTLAKMSKPLDVRYSRSFSGGPSSLTVSKTANDEYYVSFLVEEEIRLLAPTAKTIGVDLGPTHAFVTSEGEKQKPSRALKKSLKKLKRRQQGLSRKTKGSANRTKAKKKVASLCRKVQNQRLDAIHKMTTALAHENQVVCAEKLSVKKMMKDKKRARSIGDAGWGTFLQCLEYKCDWYGRTFVQVDRFFPSSKQCNGCNALYQSLSLKERLWTCSECKAFHDRDINAAKNIVDEGLRKINWNTVGLTEVKACGADVRPMW